MTAEDVVRRTLERLGRRYPLYRGCGRLGNTKVAKRFSQTGERVVPLRDGSLIHVRDDEYVGRAISYFGDLDRKISWVCRKLLRPGDVFVDVGANYGVVALQAARLVGPSGHVHAVEPQPAMVARLRASADDNGYTHMDVHACGLSGDDDVMEMFVPDVNTGAASLSRRHDTPGSTIAVEVRDAGRFLADVTHDAPARLVKLDIEGHEAAALTAAADFFTETKPGLLFESNDDAVPFWDRETTHLALGFGYTLHELPLDGLFRCTLRKLQLGDVVHGHDFLALPSGPVFGGLGL